jgi:hypothetical protein
LSALLKYSNKKKKRKRQPKDGRKKRKTDFKMKTPSHKHAHVSSDVRFSKCQHRFVRRLEKKVKVKRTKQKENMGNSIERTRFDRRQDQREKREKKMNKREIESSDGKKSRRK